MRNLTVTDVLLSAVPTISRQTPCISIDSDNDHVYCTTDSGVAVLDNQSGVVSTFISILISVFILKPLLIVLIML